MIVLTAGRVTISFSVDRDRTKLMVVPDKILVKESALIAVNYSGFCQIFLVYYDILNNA